MSGSKGGGLLHSLVIHPIKSLLVTIFAITIVLILLFPPKDAINTVGAVSVTLYRAGGVVVGSIPPGIEAFREGFKAMSEYNPPAIDYGQGASVKGKCVEDPKTKEKDC
jgi:hypothetical protein